MKKYKFILALAAIVSCMGIQASNNETLPTDPKFTVGHLENGLTYYIRPCKNPAGQAEFYIVHNVGSLQEEDNQQGLAHFLEHMAFNGTKNFEKKSFLNYFASIGVKFGSNINAYTTKDRTVYNISAVPTERKSVIDTAVLALHDWSSFISCNEQEVEAERGVVREEWRRSDDVKTRMMKAVWAYEQQGSKFAKRDVIGDINIINNFTRDELLDYYHKWYRPDLQAVIVVGDIDVDYIEQQIKSTFNKIPRVENAAKREVYTIEDHQEPNIGYFIDRDTKATSVRFSVKIPAIDAQSAKTESFIDYEQKRELLLAMLKTRFKALAKVENPKLKTAIPVSAELSYYGHTITVTSMPNGSDYDSALEALLEEYERIVRYGFSEKEFAKAAASYKLSLEQRNNQTQTNSKYVDAAVENYTRNRPLISHEYYCSLSNKLLKELDTDEMNSYVKQVWQDKNRTIVYCGNTEQSKRFTPRQKIAEILKEVKVMPMERFVLPETKGPDFREITSHATVASRKFDKEFNAEHVVMSNGLEIYWRTVKSARHAIDANYITPFGKENTDAEELPAVKMLNIASSCITLSNMPSTQKEAWFDEHGIMLFSRINSDFSRLAVTSKSQDQLDVVLKLIDGYSSSMNVNAVDLKLLKKRRGQSINQKVGPNQIYKDSLLKLQYVDPAIITGLTTEEFDAVDKKSMEEAYHRHFADMGNSYLLVTSTIPFDDAIETINGSFAEEIEEIEHSKGTNLVAPAALNKGAIDLHYKVKDLVSSKAQLAVTYHIPTKFTAKESLTLDVFGSIFRDRLMALIREEMGATYNVALAGVINNAEKPFQTIEISLDTNPALLDDVFQAIDITLDDLAKNGVTEAEIENVRLYTTKKDAYRLKSGITFITDMTKYVISGVNLNRNKEKELQKISKRDIDRLARKYNDSRNVIRSSFAPEI